MRSKPPYRRAATILFVALFALTPAFAQDAAELVKKYAEKLEGLTSYTSDITMKMNMMGMAMEMAGDLAVMDEQMIMTMNLDMMGQKMQTRSVMDKNKIMWTETDMGGMTQVVKMDMQKFMDQGAEMSGMPAPAGPMGGNPLEAVEQMLETFDLKLEGKDTIGEVEVYRFSAEIKEEYKDEIDPSGQMAEMGMDPGAMTLAIGVEDGFPREYETLGKDGKPIMTMTFANIDMNPGLDPEMFDYTPPEGAQVMDMNEMMEAEMGSGGNVALGETAPDFEGTTLDGETVNLSDFRGKVVLIDFWATWCKPCIDELPNVIDAYKAYHDKGFEIVAISLDDSREDLVEFLKEHPEMSWVNLFDGKGWEADIATQYGVEAIPHTLLLNAEGDVVRQGLRGDALSNALADLLGE